MNSTDQHGVSRSISTNLLLQAQAMEVEAWNRLVDFYAPLVYAWCRRWNLPQQDAPDVVQEVFRRVAAALPRFQRDSERSTFRGWLWTIARNETMRHFTRLNRRPPIVGGTDHQIYLQTIPECFDEQSELLDTSRLARKLLSAVQADFQDQTWQVFYRSAINGDATSDIARDFGMTQRAVRQAKHRVMSRLRELAEEFRSFDPELASVCAGREATE